MEQINIKWKKVSPADLSSINDVDYFALYKNNQIYCVHLVRHKCLFTEVILASAEYQNSLYEMEIWVGSLSNEKKKDDELNFETIQRTLQQTRKLSAENDIVENVEQKNKLFIFNDCPTTLFEKYIMVTVEARNPLPRRNFFVRRA